MSEVGELMREYRRAFTSADTTALLDCFAFPLQVVSVAGDEPQIMVADGDDWRQVLDRLLASYQRLEVVDAVPLALEVREPMAGLALATVHWALRREGGVPLYTFWAHYTLSPRDGRLRIVALAHDELPKLRDALSASPPAG